MLRGPIPQSKCFKCYVPCPLQQPSLCAAKDSWCLPQVLAMTKAIFTYLSCFEPGFFWQIRAQTAAEDVCTWVQLAHTRFGGPQVNMMATAELVESETHGPMLRENCFDVGYCYKVCVCVDRRRDVQTRWSRPSGRGSLYCSSPSMLGYCRDRRRSVSSQQGLGKHAV